MRLVIDTNVFISGVFFTGPPHRRILDAWRNDTIELILSPDILLEYQETGIALAESFPDVDLQPWLDLVITHGRIVSPPSLKEQVCTPPDDDKFLACALGSRTTPIVSGDKALLATSGFHGITVLTPRRMPLR